MEIKPIKPISRVQQADIGQVRTDRNQPRVQQPLTAPAGKWQVSGGRILLNGKDVGTLISDSQNQPSAHWSKLATDLADFKNYYIRKNARKRRNAHGDVVDDDIDPTGELGQVAALVEAYIAKIMRLLKRKYDETADGISYSLDEDGQLSLNGMNVTAFVHMARSYPSDKALVFLRGLKNRLGIILSNKSGNANYEKIRDTTLDLFKDIDDELLKIIEKNRLLEDT